jgi:hypothetical protein
MPIRIIKRNPCKFKKLRTGGIEASFLKKIRIAYFYRQFHILTTGNLKTKVVPFPFSLVTSIVPR